MKLNFTLTEEDYLIFNLYFSSKNGTLTKQRKRVRFLLVVAAALILPYGIITTNIPIIGFSVVLLLLSIFLYPWLVSKNIKTSLNTFIKANYAEYCPKEVEVCFEEDSITASNYIISNTIKSKYIKEIIEIEEYFFIKATNTNFVIIPKKHVPDFEFIRQELLKQCERHNISYEIELSWKWK